jgi:hypothetical protein
MNGDIVIQGRRVSTEDLALIRRLIVDNPCWSRRQLSQALCRCWDWRNDAGQMKDMAARALLVKLEARGLIRLPLRRCPAPNRMGLGPAMVHAGAEMPAIEASLGELGPLAVREISREREARARLAATLARHHYLGYRGTVGENLQYVVEDRQGRWLACLLFGSAAWKCRVRDEFIGWNAAQRQRRLHLVTNNARFLVLPGVRVPCLASWTLARVLARLSADWHAKYGHPIALVETFVESARFRGTCYRAANWLCLGQTTGRSRQDRQGTLRVAVKDVYVYPLRPTFRQELAR